MKTFILRQIPASVKHRIKQWLTCVNMAFLTLFALNGFLASLFYCFFSRQFYREHKAVLQGRLAYHRSLVECGQSSALLRRNIHRLEKGLIMRPRRKVFAENYILETLDSFIKVNVAPDACIDELSWATDVLTEYFSVVGYGPRINMANELFLAVENKVQAKGCLPYIHKTLPDCPLDYEAIMTLFTRRRSVRWYQDKAVDMALIRKAVQAATLAPSACNRQPYEFHVVSDSTKVAEVAKCAMGTVGFADNLPCIIVVVANLDAYPAERDRHVIYIDSALATMQLMLACETLGLSTCPINWPDIETNERVLADKLCLKYHQRPVMLLAVGYADPDGGIPFSQKKSDRLLVKEVTL
ncbi:nitroreductase family protein [Shewanella sp. VB17]|uniref:nitroreductase family protein n=1 Tax=Shewanella sp. VB17 TaxID=2739432 RepID=UPI0015649D54|nr:nitroreductase family protein [Shewanella sp. VB17]NRD74681.1 nitroreductase family protein [Shewanella sp. VB17]